VSPETLVPNPSIPAESASGVSAPYDPANFDASVMTTYGRFPLALERGKGCRLWDTEGREYLDFVAGLPPAHLVTPTQL
jgi:acetylornithine aminotransferase